MAGFSVKISDVSDFIAPSQACIVNLDGSKKAPPPQSETGTVALQPRGSSAFAQARSPDGDAAAAAGPVKVTLNDCLACAGCVTSAETVLMEQQSTAEMLARLRQGGSVVVVSVSPQSRASLAALHGLTSQQAFRKLSHFLRALGVAHVLDISAAREVALQEAAAEFVARYRQANARDSSNGAAAGPARAAAAGGDAQAALPMLASACPGWVCYAEKTHGDYVLPHISTAKSPQAVQGSLVKRWLAGRNGIAAASVYHVAVMPCYDKKLEASRSDFELPGGAGPEVDCVLSSLELAALLQERGVQLAALPDAPIDSVLPPPAPHGGGGAAAGAGLARDEEAGSAGLGGGAGGYLEHVFRAAARELFGREVPPGPLALRTLRNADMKEVVLEGEEGRVLLRFAAAYGFRNIQTLVRKVKRRACEYDYVEVMACPSGCNNGGGQVRPAGGESVAALLERVEATYHESLRWRDPGDSPAAQALYRAWVGGAPGSAPARTLLHTQYHRRDKTLAAAVTDW